MRKQFTVAAVSLLILSSSYSFASDNPSKATTEEDTKGSIEQQITKATATAPINEATKSTKGSVTVKGQKIDYTATAGTLTIRDNEGVPIASVFYVAYTANAGKNRPITFMYNGGPVSASLWLHMGSIGPMRVRTTSPEHTGPAPYTLTPNEETILDKTDLVFIDAIGTGYSRPLGKTKGEKFWGVDQDVDAFARAIKRYVTINERWNSPKFLFGESYGTTRSANLVNVLQNQGMDFNGVILMSSILNYGIRQPGFDNIYTAYLPSYAATAWYHNKIQNKPADLSAFVEQARQFASGEYAVALAKGHNISLNEKQAIANKISYFTGLSTDFILKSDLRVNLSRFRKEILRDSGVTVGRFDSRFKGFDEDDAGENPEFDASSTNITSAFVSTLRDYLTKNIGYKTDLEYNNSASSAYHEFRWDWKHNNGKGVQQMPDVAMDLGNAMRQNPHLKLLSLNGYYDMATPFFATEYDISHIPMPEQTIKNISFKYYPSGHMIYLNEDAMEPMVKDLKDFYDIAAPKK